MRLATACSALVASVFCASSTLAFTNRGPNFCRLSYQKHASPRASQSALYSTRKSSARHKSKHLNDKEFQWLYWLYREWNDQPVGQLDSSVLKQMVPAMSKWARRSSSPKSAQRAQQLLERYVEEYLAGNKEAVLATPYFNTVMDAWRKSGEKDAPQKVQSLIQWMRELRKEHGLSQLHPDVISLSTLAAAWAKSRVPEGAVKAQEILTYMEDRGMEPSTKTYNAVLHSLVFSPDRDKAVRAQQLIDSMNKSENCRPDVCSYQCLISAWSRTDLQGTPQKAEKVLQFMDNQDDPLLKPNIHCYTAAIHAWANSMEGEKAQRAYRILAHVKKLYQEEGNASLKPNVVAFTAVINACASPADPSEHETAFQIAQLTMEELLYSDYGKPNFLTYASFLAVCATTIAEDDAQRDAIVKRTFQQCCKDGQVGQIVLEKLKWAASPELYQELVTDRIEKDGRLPEEWTQNVQGERASSKRQSSKRNFSIKTKSELSAVRVLKGSDGHYSKGTNDQVPWANESF